jgi:hypothetical protein
MSKLANLVKNKWFILGISLLNASFTGCLCAFAYWVFFYKIEYSNRVLFAALYSVFSLVTGFLMFYTRKSPLTTVFCMANVVILFPSLLMDWGNWGLIVPALIVTVFGFFCCRMNDTLKTVMGTVFLLMYLLGGVAFFLVTQVFTAKTIDTVIDAGVSPSGDFRYYVVDQQNNASGKKVVFIEPNMLDVDMKFLMLDTTIRRVVKQAVNPAVVECRWSGKKLLINGETYFNEEDFVTMSRGERFYDFSHGNWTHTYFNVDYPFIELIHSVTEAITNKLSESDGESDPDGETV